MKKIFVVYHRKCCHISSERIIHLTKLQSRFLRPGLYCPKCQQTIIKSYDIIYRLEKEE